MLRANGEPTKIAGNFQAEIARSKRTDCLLLTRKLGPLTKDVGL